MSFHITSRESNLGSPPRLPDTLRRSITQALTSTRAGEEEGTNRFTLFFLLDPLLNLLLCSEDTHGNFLLNKRCITFHAGCSALDHIKVPMLGRGRDRHTARGSKEPWSSQQAIPAKARWGQQLNPDEARKDPQGV